MMKQLSNILQVIRQSSVLRAGIWYTVGNFVAKIIGFLAIPLFTRLLSPAEYGIVTIMMTWVTIAMIVAPLYVQVIPLRGKFDFGDDYEEFISSVTSLGILSSLSIVALLFFIPEEWGLLLFDLPKILLILGASTVPFGIAYRMKLGVWQSESKGGYYILTTLTLNVLTILLSIFLILLPTISNVSYPAVWGRISAIIFIQILAGTLYIFPMLKSMTFYNKKYWTYALTYALPLVPHALSGVILANFDRIMISNMLGRTDAGIYSYGYQIGAIIALLSAAIAAAWLPWFYQKMNDEEYQEIRRNGSLLIIGFTGLTILSALISVWIAPLLAPASYSGAVKIIPIVIVGGYFIFLQYFFIGIETYEKKTWFTSIATLMVAGVNILLNWYFIPQYGIIAAAWTTLVSYMLLLLIHIVVVRYVLKSNTIFHLPLMFFSSMLCLLIIYIMII